MKKRALIWLLTAALLASLLTGCQSGGQPESEPEQPPEEETILDESAVANEPEDTPDDSGIVTATKQDKARTVITTDGEVDDQDSVIRALLYANDMDIAGIVLTSSMYHYAGDESKGVEPYRWTGTEWIYHFLDAYEQVYDNLKAHDPEYPEPSYLKSVTHIGNISDKGEMEEVTEGAEFLKELFLDDDPRTLYVQTWGGTNTTARALKSIEEEYKDTDQWEEIQNKINEKVVLYIILDQDESYGDYIAQNWPDLMIINDRSNFWHFAYAWQFHSDELNDTLKAAWNVENLLDKGPLMDYYALMGDGKMLPGELYDEQRGTDDYLAANPNYERYDFISEGDSPSFFYLLDTGLRSLENPSYGGWGGRFGQEGDRLYKNTVVDYNPYSERYEAQYTLSRWFTDIQNDFAARTDWCLTDDDTAVNHAPTLSVTEGIDLTAAPGQTVTLTAVGKDQDGDTLSYHWWRYFEADTYQDTEYVNEIVGDDSIGLLLDLTRELADGEPTDTIAITGADQAQMSFTVPEDAKKGDTIHMIAEVQDDGAHTLKHYQRVIITVRDPEAEKTEFLNTLQSDGYAEVGKYKVEQIRDGVYHMDEGTEALPGGASDADGNMNNPSSIYFVVTDEGVLMVDGGNPPGDGTDTETDAKIIVETLTDGKPVTMIFTHSHGDHTGLARSKAVFENVRMEKVYIGGPDLDTASEAIEQFLPIVETLDAEDSISVYGNTYDTYIVNAHTDGALMIVDRVNERVFTGDTFGSGFVWVLWGTNDGNPLAALYDGLEQAAEIVGAMNDPVLLAGHRWQQFWENNAERPEEMTAQYYTDMRNVLDGLSDGETVSAEYSAWPDAVELSRDGAKAKIDTMPEYAEAFLETP